MTDELVQRLRMMSGALGGSMHGDLYQSAADAIESLRSEVEALKAGSEWDVALQMNADFNRISNQRTTIQQLQSELAALRKRVEDAPSWYYKGKRVRLVAED